MPNTNRLLTSVHTITRLLSSTVDLDEGLRRTLEAAVQAVEASGGSILLHDPTGRKLWFRHVIGGETQGKQLPAGFGLYGVSIDENEGIAGQVFQSQTPRIENNVADNPQHAKHIDESFQFETRNLITVPIRYPGGKPLGVMQLVNKREGDFTEEDLTVLDIVACVSAMSAQNADLTREAQRSKALDYVGRVAQDLQTKTAGLTESAERLGNVLDGALGETAEALREQLQTVAGGIKDIQRYADFLLATIEGRPVAIHREENDFVAVVENQLGLLGAEARSKYGVTLVSENEKPSLVFSFDRFLVERALFNLVTNALKATPAGGSVTVRTAEEDDAALLEVRDTGQGMPHYLLERMLTVNLADSKVSGVGLSTLIVKEVAEKHHGVLEGESAESVGSMFRLRLPLTH